MGGSLILPPKETERKILLCFCSFPVTAALEFLLVISLLSTVLFFSLKNGRILYFFKHKGY